MRKHRIVKVDSNDNIHYELQRKGIFFWISITEFECCIDGMGSDMVLKFDSIQEAEKYYNSFIKTISVCKIL